METRAVAAQLIGTPKYAGSTMSDTARRLASQPKPLSRRALRDGVYDTVLEMLLSGQVPPESSLSIDGLARDLEVSPTPVREALVQLEHTGLVTRAALRGYRVAPPLTPEQMSELVDARAVLEIAAVARAADHIPEFLPELEAAHARHLSIVAALPPEPSRTRGVPEGFRDYFDADWAFHLVFMRHSGNRYLLSMAQDLGTHIHRLRQSVLHGLSDVQQAMAEHQAVLDACRRGDGPGAVAAMRAHLTGVRNRAAAEA